MQGFVTHQPACFEALWRCGALPGLVVTVAKAALAAAAADKVRASALQCMADLLHAMLLPPPAPGQQPWFAASSERLQFVVFVLARIGGEASTAVLKHPRANLYGAMVPLGSVEGVTGVIDELHAAGQQLAQQPLLRQQLEAAAPALPPDADAASAVVRGWASHSDSVIPGFVALDIRPAALQLLVSLARQLDPLALGLRLPGCYNPACTSLAGDCEAAMALRRCSSCSIAR